MAINQDISQYRYVIDLNERGIFQAHVEHEDGEIVFKFSNLEDGEEQEELWIVADGFMENIEDLSGLHKCLIDLGIIPELSDLSME